MLMGLSLVLLTAGIVWLSGIWAGNDVQSAGPIGAPAEPVASLSVPTEPLGTLPHQSDGSETTVEETPSQTPGNAARDQVLPEVAALPLSERVGELARVTTEEGVWVLSRMPSPEPRSLGRCDTAGPDCIYGLDFVSTSEYAEILLLNESGEIVRAFPMPMMPPSWIYADGDFVYAGRIGDGGLPDSTVLRIHGQSRTLLALYLPYDDLHPTDPGMILWAIDRLLFPGWLRSDVDPTFLSVGGNEVGGVQVESWVGDVYVDIEALRQLLVQPEGH